MTTDIHTIELRSLAGIPFDEISRAFLAAFADYGMDLDTDKLRDMLTRRGARFDLSFAAFDAGRIVSFIINGIGSHDGRPTAYDTGTGTLEQYRGRGLTDRIFAYSTAFLRNAGIETYLLEVLKHNIPAVKIYVRQGFEIAREFDCYAAGNDAIVRRRRPSRNPDIEIREVPAAYIRELTPFMDFVPSWQNSPNSIERNPRAFVCIAACKAGIPVGFGVSETAYGDISLLAVDRAHRRHGIGSEILSELVAHNRCRQTKVLNVDHTCGSMKAFLSKTGFEPTCRQYEMIKHLT